MGYFLNKDSMNPISWPTSKSGQTLKIGDTSIPSISPLSGLSGSERKANTGTGPGGSPRRCSEDSECAPNQYCLDGRCVQQGGDKIACQADWHCPEGQVCVGGYCQPTEPQDCAGNSDCVRRYGDGWVCQGGKCVDKTTCLGDQECVDKYGPGWKCRGGKCIGPETQCTKNTDCPEGQTCVNGVCTSVTGDCGKGKVTSGQYPNGKTIEGCPCSAAYYPNEGQACREGYTAKGEGADYRCECDLNTSDGTDTGTFDWSTGLANLMAMLQGRAGEYLNMKPGFGDSALTSMFGAGFDKVRGVGDATRSQLLGDLQTQGLAGTSTGSNLLRSLGWNTESNVGNLMREVFNANEAQKRTDLSNYTDIASRLTGQGAGFEQLKEAINASRRGESRDYLGLLMSYLSSLMSSWAQ